MRLQIISKSKLWLFARAFFVLLLAISITLSIIPANSVKAATTNWYNSSWLYRQQLTVYGSNSAVLTDYPKLLRVYKGAGVLRGEAISQYTTGANTTLSENATYRIGQTFRAETSVTVKEVWLNLIKVGSPTNTVTCNITATSANLPTTAICSGTIKSSYISTTADWYKFDLGNGGTLTAGTTYAIEIHGSDNISNYVGWRANSSGAYSEGGYVYSSNSGSSWSSTPDTDLMYQVVATNMGATPFAIYCNNYCSDNFSDIRFTKGDGETPLSYWIENTVIGSYADIWVKLDTVPQMTSQNQNNTFYIYYGNSLDVSASSGASVFTHFEDFESYVVGSDMNGQGGWTATTGGVVVSSDHSSLSSNNCAKILGSATVTDNMSYTIAAVSQTYSIGFHAWKENASKFKMSHGSASNSEAVYVDTDEIVKFTDAAGTYVSTSMLTIADNWTKYDLYSEIFNTSYVIRCAENISYTCQPAVNTSFNGIFCLSDNLSGVFNDTYIDNFFIAKFAVSQPLWGIPLAVETSSTSLTIQDVKVFSSYKNAGDWLITVRYLNTYAPYYDTYDIKKYFVLQLVDNVTVKAQNVLPAWGNKVANIYLSAAEVTGLNWGGAYKVRIYGNFSPYPYVDHTLQSSDWVGDDLTQLDSWILSSAAVISTYYSTTMTTYIADRGEVLNTTGGAIFSSGINGLTTKRPNIFQINTQPTAYTPNATPQNYIATVGNWQANWGADGTLMLERIGNIIGMSGDFIGSIFFVVLMVALALWAFPAGHSTSANILCVPALFIGIFFGVNPIFIGILAMLAAFLLIKNLWLDK